jgi:hypothetical protein
MGTVKRDCGVVDLACSPRIYICIAYYTLYNHNVLFEKVTHGCDYDPCFERSPRIREKSGDSAAALYRDQTRVRVDHGIDTTSARRTIHWKRAQTCGRNPTRGSQCVSQLSVARILVVPHL